MCIYIWLCIAGFGGRTILFEADGTACALCLGILAYRRSGSGPRAQPGLPAHRVMWVLANKLFSWERSRLPAHNAMWVRADGQSCSGQSGLPHSVPYRFKKTDGLVLSGWHCKRKVPCGLRHTDRFGLVCSSRDCQRSVPCGFGQTDSPFWARWHYLVDGSAIRLEPAVSSARTRKARSIGSSVRPKLDRPFKPTRHCARAVSSTQSRTVLFGAIGQSWRVDGRSGSGRMALLAHRDMLGRADRWN